MTEETQKWALDAVAAITGLDVLEILASQGYTICRETMTEAELEREAYELADAVSKASCKGQISAATLRNRMTALAKKYRG